MQYKLTMSYPDGKVVHSKGVTAISKNAYFDSSDRHYLFYNKDWYINANHDDKHIVVMNMNKVNEQLGGFASFSPFQFLFSSDDFFENVQITVLKINGDTVQVGINSLVYTEIEQLIISLNKATMIPFQYDIKIRIPMANLIEIEEPDDSYLSQFVLLESTCFAFEHPAQPKYFDSSKIIHTVGKKSVLRKFNSYLTYTSKK